MQYFIACFSYFLSLAISDGLLSQESIKAIPDIGILFADPGVIGQVLGHENHGVKWIQNTFAGKLLRIKIMY